MGEADHLMKYRRIVADWERGAMSESEFSLRLFQSISAVNVREVWSTADETLRELLSREVTAAPATEDGWAQVRIVNSYCGSELTTHQHQEQEAEQVRRFRAGVEAVRNYLKTI